MTTVLPTRLHPRADESLHGYARRLSHLIGAPLGTVLERLGLFSGDRLGWGCLLTDAHVEDVAHALDLPPQAVEAMTLRAYDHVLRLPGPAQWRSLGGWAATEWVLLQGGRFCPACLAQRGAWRLAWRLPELIGCLEHDRLLEHVCPGCEGLPNRGHGGLAEVGFVDFVHHPSRCFSPARIDVRGSGRGALPCGQDLTRAVTRTLSPREREITALVGRLHTGEHVVLAGHPRPPLLARRLLREVVSVATHLVVRQDKDVPPGIRWYRSPPLHPGWVSKMLASSHDWLLAADPEQALDLLRVWLHRPDAPPPSIASYRHLLSAKSVLEPLVAEALRGTGRPSQRANRLRNPQLLQRPPYLDRLPQLAWACALPGELQGSRQPAVPFLQAVLSLQLARRATVSWEQAGQLLGLPAGKGARWPHYVYVRLPPELREQFLAAAERLHTQLLNAPAWQSAPVLAHRAMPALQQGRCVRDGAPWCPCQGTCSPDRRRRG